MGPSSFAWLHSHVIFIEWMAASNVLGLVGLQLFRLKVSFLLPSVQLRFHLLSVSRRPVLARPDARRSATRLRPRHTPLDDPHRRSSHGRAAPHPPGARFASTVREGKHGSSTHQSVILLAYQAWPTTPST